jgi:flagellar protein FliS
MKFVGKVYSDNDAETSVSSSNSSELILLVYERIFDQLQTGKFELSQGRFGIDFLSKASDLINLGLLSSLDFNKGGEIAVNLKLIYEWALKTINEARIKKSPEKIQEVIDILKPLYEAWEEIAV